MPGFVLPDSFVGGSIADADPRETLKERFDGTQRNFEKLALFLNEFAGRFFWGTGTPEGAVTAPVGCIYLRLNGGAGTTLYVKESGTGNTGWVGK
jgi:hypothetical protein